MSQRKITATMTVSFEFTIEFDDESPEFIQALDDYRTAIHENGDEESMLRHVLFNFGLRNRRFVEGVGCINFVPDEDDFPNSGITVATELEEDVEFEFEEEDL